MKIIFAIAGLLIAAVGGVIAYRAWFLEPAASVLITNTDVHELPNYTKIVGGIVLLLVGAAISFLALRPRK